MLAHRVRRWPSIKLPLYKCFLYAGMYARARIIVQVTIYCKGRTIRYQGGGGGGGARVFVACKLFFTCEKKQSFFGDQRPTIFFYVSSKNFLVECFPFYVRYDLVFFLVNIFLINFDNKFFLLPTFSTNFFF